MNQLLYLRLPLTFFFDQVSHVSAWIHHSHLILPSDVILCYQRNLSLSFMQLFIEQLSVCFKDLWVLIDLFKVAENVFVSHDVKGKDHSLIPLGVDNSVTQHGKYFIVRRVLGACYLFSAIHILVHQVFVDDNYNVLRKRQGQRTIPRWVTCRKNSLDHYQTTISWNFLLLCDGLSTFHF